MERPIDPYELSSILRTMSASTFAGLLSASPDMKGRAADRVAMTVIERLDPNRRPDPSQLALPL
jgi:hypothetical protein